MQYVAIFSVDNEKKQTFVLDGAVTLDAMFEEIGKRNRIDSSWANIGQAKKVYALSVHRDESKEPTNEEEFESMLQASALS